MQPSSKQVVLRLIQQAAPSQLLDVPSGGGWLPNSLQQSLPDCQIDGIDLYAERNNHYRQLIAHDLDQGLPAGLPSYPMIVSCEGIEHFGNPEQFLSQLYQQLQPGGQLIITTPNTWYPAAKLQYLLRGFFPSFPALAGKIKKGSHMHISPWSYPHLYLYLSLVGFQDIQLHPEALSRAKHLWERPLGKPQQWYCRRKQARAKSQEERHFWQQAGSQGSVYGRHLILSARRPKS